MSIEIVSNFLTQCDKTINNLIFSRENPSYKVFIEPKKNHNRDYIAFVTLNSTFASRRWNINDKINPLFQFMVGCSQQHSPHFFQTSVICPRDYCYSL